MSSVDNCSSMLFRKASLNSVLYTETYIDMFTHITTHKHTCVFLLMQMLDSALLFSTLVFPTAHILMYLISKVTE